MVQMFMISCLLDVDKRANIHDEYVIQLTTPPIAPWFSKLWEQINTVVIFYIWRYKVNWALVNRNRHLLILILVVIREGNFNKKVED